MIRKLLLGGIMLVCVGILIFALQKQRARERAERLPPADNETVTKPPPPEGFRLTKFDRETNEAVAVITGTQFTETAVRGPIEIVKPTIVLLKDKNTRTVIMGDNGRVEGRENDKMDEGWLKGNVTLTVTDVETGDNTVLTCQEMQYHGSKSQVFIPGEMKIVSRSMEVTGSRLTADGNLGKATLEKDVRLEMKEAAGGALDQLAGPPTPEAPKEQKPPQPVVVTCDGTLVFYRDMNRATFEKNVLARQGDDSVRGDNMTVEFERTGRAAGEGEKPQGSQLTMRRVVVGSDRKEGVVVDGPTRQAWGERLEYDGTAGLLVFSGSPCRTVQKSASQTYRINGDEVRFARQGLLPAQEKLPEGMNAESQKVLITGNPASAIGVSAEGAQLSRLTGRRILFDQDTRVVWIQGDKGVPATAEQEKNRVTGVEIEFFQKTETRGEKVLGRGPGRLEITRQGGAGKTAAQPTVVNFGDTMAYLPDQEKAEFTGGVALVDGATTSNSRTLSIEIGEGKEPGSMEVKRMVATGEVVVKGEGRTATGDTLVYNYPPGGTGPFTAVLTAKPEESCEIKSDDFVWRSSHIDLKETPAQGRRNAIHAKGLGKGYFLYRPAAKPAEAASEPFEVFYEKSGTFDEVALQAVFEGDARVRRPGMNLDAQNVVMDFVRGKNPDPQEAKGQDNLDLDVLTAVVDVTVTSGQGDDLSTATGTKLVWRRGEGTASLEGGESPQEPARVVCGTSSIEAPLMVAFLRNNELDRAFTRGGGRLTGYTRPKQPTSEGKLQRTDVTWTGNGLYQTLPAANPQTEPTSMARVQGNTRALSEDGDVTADTLMVYLGPGPKKPSGEQMGLEVRRAVAVGGARGKMFMPEGNYWRYARGDSLDWDRVLGRMIVMSEKGDAVVWDNSNEWTGTRLVVNRTAEGRVVAESTSGRRITFYEEGTPRVPAEDARKWKPIY